jgi:hypothetical protein
MGGVEMDGVELTKRKINITRQDDIEKLRAHTLWLLEQCWALSQSHSSPDNYRVDGWTGDEWSICLASGTKDFCIGWVEGKDERWVYGLQVACGDFVVWPEEWYALSAELSPGEKDKIAAELEIQS